MKVSFALGLSFALLIFTLSSSVAVYADYRVDEMSSIDADYNLESINENITITDSEFISNNPPGNNIDAFQVTFENTGTKSIDLQKINYVYLDALDDPDSVTLFTRDGDSVSRQVMYPGETVEVIYDNPESPSTLKIVTDKGISDSVTETN